MTDDLMLVKFQFFKNVGSALSFYLTKFQTDTCLFWQANQREIYAK